MEMSKSMHKTLDLARCLFTAVFLCWNSVVSAQGTHCDPKKVLTSEGCIKCHAQADAVWKQTPHFKTFATLYKKPEAKLIAQKMGVGSIKRGDLCVKCHYTQTEKEDGRLKPVSGVSCESCHGAGKDWVPVHNDYGGLQATKQSESAEHAMMRLANSRKLGMRNPHNLYDIAQSCLACHTVPNEKLVNVGGHSQGSLEFELVSWSQGSLRHNFLRTNGQANAESDQNRLRVMWLAGLIADLEFSTRAVAMASDKQKYGLTVAKRAADKALLLYKVQQSLKNEHLETILRSFARAELKINNSKQLEAIANEIQSAGRAFAAEENGSQLKAVDSYLPPKTAYK